MSCPLNKQCDEPAIINGKQIYSYKECDALCSGIALELSKQGIGPTSIVAFQADNSIATILTFFALFRLKAVCCPLSTRLPSIHNEVQQLGATHVIIPKLYGKSSRQYQLEWDALATYIFTSGSTGKPKIAMHTLSNHIYSALGINSYFNLKPTDRWQLSLPLWHVGGLAILFRCFLAGASVVLSGQATHTSWVPTQLQRQLQENLDYKAILLGGAPLATKLKLQASHLPLYPSYGLTEMSSTVLVRDIPLPYRRVKIVDGELYVAGPTLFQGYLNEKPQIGWFATGDLVASDFTIIGRKDRLLISGGENIQPEEIERALLQIPGIQAACVVGVEDPEFGMRPVAFVDSPCVCKEKLSDLLPKFKHPIRYFALPPFQGKPNFAHLTAQAKLLMQG